MISTIIKILQNNPLLKSTRQPKNLKKILTRAKFETYPKINQITKCGDPRCGICLSKQLIEGTEIDLKCGINFIVKNSMTCYSTNLLYVLICSGCKNEYIGETGDTLRAKMRVHRQQIQDDNYRILHVSKHIHECAKEFHPQFKVMPFYKMSPDSTKIEREVKERQFIKKCKPSLNTTTHK